MNSFRFLLCLFFLNLAMISFAYGSGYEFEGIGARQVSRGGAAIASSDDWTSIYWNPGNIVGSVQKNGAEFGLEFFGGRMSAYDSNSLSGLPGIGAIFSKTTEDSNYLLGATGCLIPVGKKAALALGFYTPLLQGSKFQDSSKITPSHTLDFKSSAGILTWNVSGSFQLSPTLSAGVGLDILYGRVVSKNSLTGYPFSGNTISTDLEADGIAPEGIFGLKYNPHSKVALGAVYRTGGDVKLKGHATVNNTSLLLPNEKSGVDLALRHPPTAGLGAAYQPNGRLILSLDLNETYWRRFTDAKHFDTQGVFLQDSGNTFHWKNAWKIRFGSEFKLTDYTDLMAGYSFGSPALDAGSVDLSTAVDVYMNGVSVGLSHSWTPRWETILGVLGGYGTRREGDVRYRVTGLQLMAESSWKFNAHN